VSDPGGKLNERIKQANKHISRLDSGVAMLICGHSRGESALHRRAFDRPRKRYFWLTSTLLFLLSSRWRCWGSFTEVQPSVNKPWWHTHTHTHDLFMTEHKITRCIHKKKKEKKKTEHSGLNVQLLILKKKRIVAVNKK